MKTFHTLFDHGILTFECLKMFIVKILVEVEIVLFFFRELNFFVVVQ